MITDYFAYGFFWRALLTGILLAVLCSVLGTFLVLRKLSLVGDGLAHVAFAGVAVGLFFGIDPLLSAIVAVLIGSLLLYHLLTKAKVSGDSATALILSLSVGLAVVLIGLSRGFTVDLFSYLFGSILTVRLVDLFILSGVFVLALFFVVAYYRQLLLITFNAQLARLSGVKVDLLNTLFALLVGLTVVTAIRAVGIMLVSALIVLPVLSALQLGSSFRSTLLFSLTFSVCAVLLGLFLSLAFDLTPGGTIVLLMGAMYGVVYLVKNVVR